MNLMHFFSSVRLGFFSLMYLNFALICACKKSSTVENNLSASAEHRASGRGNDRRSDTKIFTSGNPELASDLEMDKAFRARLANGGDDLVNLVEEIVNSAPEAKRTTLLAQLASKAGKENNWKVLEKLATLNPGNMRKAALIHFSREIRDLKSVQTLLSKIAGDDFLPDERRAIDETVLGAYVGFNRYDLNSLIVSQGTKNSELVSLYYAYGSKLAEEGVQLSATLLESIPEGKRGEAKSSYWISRIKGAPEDCEKLWQEGKIDGTGTASIGRTLIDSKIKRSSFKEALAFAQKSPDKAMIPGLTEYLFGRWVDHDSIEASRAATSLEEGPTRRAAAKAIANYLQSVGDVGAAKEWRQAETNLPK
jgi:hypothetical protein